MKIPCNIHELSIRLNDTVMEYRSLTTIEKLDVLLYI